MDDARLDRLNLDDAFIDVTLEMRQAASGKNSAMAKLNA
jgi:hypothetical protein